MNEEIEVSAKKSDPQTFEEMLAKYIALLCRQPATNNTHYLMAKEFIKDMRRLGFQVVSERDLHPYDHPGKSCYSSHKGMSHEEWSTRANAFVDGYEEAGPKVNL